MFVRTAIPDDTLEIRRIIDAAMLEVGDVESRIDGDNVLVAGDRRGGSGAQDRLLGTAVLVPTIDEDDAPGARISAIAVRRRHRNQGIGHALIRRALEREGRLTARFDTDVRPFYDAVGFSIERIDDSRYRGVIVASDALGPGGCS
ncbi:N-acetyltransferase [Salinadaptatus halalkaliphilus]|uniref:N-acetyltransferase n=1 Tax=Salinadaptatus halalkaliphilus TaxID=2419781 RepID=A0A4S3TKV5_9EURY|nr:GNAT family N-acetyltransferase [Salinadaptatus halalkaliphilus]THE64676.1 N-acetyltransferase [Salinadaptatus halalkaliphilus]